MLLFHFLEIDNPNVNMLLKVMTYVQRRSRSRGETLVGSSCIFFFSPNHHLVTIIISDNGIIF